VSLEIERRFLVELKSFVFSVLDGASVLRVEEKRKGFSGEVLSSQCTVWLASAMEVLLGFHGGDEVLIVRRGGNKDGWFLEVATNGMGGQRGYLRILEGRGGWCWHKFSGELRKAKYFLFAMVGCGFGSVFGGEEGWEGGGAKAGNGFELHGAFVCGGGEVVLVP
jgi:hypothetical protein